jgi:hypothetical protein
VVSAGGAARAAARPAAAATLAALARGLACGLALSACASAELAAPVLRARTGPAAERPVRRVVATPSTCGTLGLSIIGAGPHAQVQQHVRCTATAMRAVDQLVRANLELGGFSVIDAEKVNAVTAARREVQLRRQHLTVQERPGLVLARDGAEAVTTEVETQGARFEDATPREQQEMISELGAQGVLATRITIGAGVGIGMRRLATVQLQLVEMPARALVWARRCELEVGGLFISDELAMERAARCASEGIVAR